MGAFAALLLIPRVVLLPPDAPPDLRPTAEASAEAVATSHDLDVTRLAPATSPSPGLGDRVRADIDAAAESYRQLSFRDAKEQAERAVAVLQAEAATTEDFDLLLQARLRLAMVLLAQRRPGPARQVLEAAARSRPDAEVTEGDYPPNLVSAFEAARTVARRQATAPLEVAVRTAIAGVEPTAWIDGRPAEGASSDLPAGEHVLVATAPGHRPVRQVVRLPASAPVTIALEATVPVAEGIVLAMAFERVGRQVRITVRRHGGGEASREVDPAAVAATTRELAETLAGVPRAVASAGTSGTQGTGDAAHGGASGRVGSAGGRRGGSGRSGPPDEGGGSVFGKWWFWTIVGGVVVIGVLGLAAANRRDQGTDVHVGIAP